MIALTIDNEELEAAITGLLLAFGVSAQLRQIEPATKNPEPDAEDEDHGEVEEANGTDENGQPRTRRRRRTKAEMEAARAAEAAAAQPVQEATTEATPTRSVDEILAASEAAEAAENETQEEDTIPVEEDAVIATAEATPKRPSLFGNAVRPKND